MYIAKNVSGTDVECRWKKVRLTLFF